MLTKDTWLNGMRVNLAEFRRSTVGDDTADGYASSAEAHVRDRALLDEIGRIADGFRVEIPDQTTNPGLFVVHNGFAIDRAGRPFERDDDADSQQSKTLSLVSTTHFVEVEQRWVLGQVDSRAFRNPEWDNGTAPSGDPRPAGREYTRQVATRWVCDWKILANTTGFTAVATPSSRRIPIGVLTTDGTGKITGATTAAWKSTIREAVAPLGKTLKCWSTRIAPGTFSVEIVDPTTGGVVHTDTVTANDRANGFLTISAGPASAVRAGCVVRNSTASPPVFLAERTAALPLQTAAAPWPTTGSQDARARLFNAGAGRGHSVLQDPYSTTLARSTVQLSSDTRWRAAVEAKFLELTRGGMLPADTADIFDDRIGQSRPPRVVPSNDDWTQRVRGVPGAAGPTISIGSGTDSFGDLNVNAFTGGFQECMQRAVDYLSTTGGTIQLRPTATSYTIGNTSIFIASITKKIAIVAEAIVTIFATGTEPILSLFKADVEMENLWLRRDAACNVAAVMAVTGTGLGGGDATTVRGKRCLIEGLVATTQQNVVDGAFEACIFAATNVGAGSNGYGLYGKWQGEFRKCTLSSAINAAGSRALLADAGSKSRFAACSFLTSGAAITAMVELLVDAADYTFEDCAFTGDTGAVCFTGAPNRLTLDRCSNSGTAGMLAGLDAASLTMRGCRVTFAADQIGVSLLSSAGNTSGHRIDDCTFTQTASSGGSRLGTAIVMADVENVRITDLKTLNCDRGVSLTGVVKRLSARRLDFECTTAGVGRVGVRLVADAQSVDIDGVWVTGFSDATVNTIYGVYAESTASTSTALTVANVSARNIGSASATATTVVAVKGSWNRPVVHDVSFYNVFAGGAGGVACAVDMSPLVPGSIASQLDIRRIGGDYLYGLQDSYGVRLGAWLQGSVSDLGFGYIGQNTSPGVVTTRYSFGLAIGQDATGTLDQQGLSVRNVQVREVRTTAGASSLCRAVHIEAAENARIEHVSAVGAQSGAFGFDLIGMVSKGGGAVCRNITFVDPQLSGASMQGIVLLGRADDKHIAVRGGSLRNVSGDGIEMFRTGGFAGQLTDWSVRGTDIEVITTGAHGILVDRCLRLRLQDVTVVNTQSDCVSGIHVLDGSQDVRVHASVKTDCLVDEAAVRVDGISYVVHVSGFYDDTNGRVGMFSGYGVGILTRVILDGFNYNRHALLTQGAGTANTYSINCVGGGAGAIPWGTWNGAHDAISDATEQRNAAIWGGSIDAV